MDSQSVGKALDNFFEWLLPVHGTGVILIVAFLQIVFLIVGLVRLFKADSRTHGWITIVNSLLYLVGIFLIDNGYMPVAALVVFGVAAAAAGLWNLSECLGYDKKENTIAMIVYGGILAALVVVQILVSGQSVTEYFGQITLMQWGYIVLFVCMGIRHMNLVITAVLLTGISFSYAGSSTSSHEDPVAWATGEEQSVDTVSMSDDPVT